jgi:hypothetical protein
MSLANRLGDQTIAVAVLPQMPALLEDGKQTEGKHQARHERDKETDPQRS